MTTPLSNPAAEIRELDQKTVLADYRMLRATGKTLVGPIMEHLTPSALVKAARLLGRLEGEKTIILDTEDETAVLMDYAIHEIFDDRKNAIDRMLQEAPPPEGSIEMRVLRSLRTAHYSVFEVLDTVPGFAVRAIDIFRETKISIVDIGFSQTTVPGTALAARIHSPGDGWWMTTGAGLPITDQARDRIVDGIAAYTARRGKTPIEADLTLLIVRACLKAGASQHVAYATVGEPLPRAPRPGEEMAAPIRSSTKVGRNEACPCGSGKKHKKCCGK